LNGHPGRSSKTSGKINNVAHPDPLADTDIFSAKATFKPQRLFKMTRSKAYLPAASRSAGNAIRVAEGH
jgi:topoisomerase-4 subunit B